MDDTTPQQDRNGSISNGSNPPISAEPVPAVSIAASVKKPSKFAGLFSGFRKPKVLLKAVATLVGVAVIFYAGYQFAIYQTDYNNLTLPHVNFNHVSQNGSCPAGDTPEYGGSLSDTPQQDERPICLRPGQMPLALKPVIYLYPTHQERVDVRLHYITGTRQSLPVYNKQTGWQVIASPNGQLTNISDGKSYPYLFWEGNPAPLSFNMNTGFVVAGSNTASFLQRQLTAMGLDQNETNAFIAYWLPKMEHNKYNVIHFAGNEYTNAAKLTISPQPDSMLRVFMVYAPLQAPVKVTPQTFAKFKRVGFTVVEWGGTELDY